MVVLTIMTKKYCWTRDLPFDQAQILTNELSKIYTVAQITRPNCNKLNNAVQINDISDKKVFLSLLMHSEKEY